MRYQVQIVDGEGREVWAGRWWTGLADVRRDLSHLGAWLARRWRGA